MRYLNWIWYGPYFVVSLVFGLACIFVKHHLEHLGYARTHRSEVELIRAAKKAARAMKHHEWTPEEIASHDAWLAENDNLDEVVCTAGNHTVFASEWLSQHGMCKACYAEVSGYQCSGCKPKWCDGCSPL